MSDPYQVAPTIFYPGAKTGEPLSYQSLVARRKIVEALLGKRNPYPKTIGEGLASLGQSVGDRARLDELDAAETARQSKLDVDAKEQARLLEGEGPAVTTAPGAAAATRDYTPPEPVPEAPTAPRPAPSSNLPQTPALLTQQALRNYGERRISPPEVPQVGAPSTIRTQRAPPDPNSVPPYIDPNAATYPRDPNVAQPRQRSDLGDPRDRIAMADLRRQGVVQPDPTVAQATSGPTVPAASTAEDDPYTAMAEARNPAIVREDLARASRPPAPSPFDPPTPAGPLPEPGRIGELKTLTKPVPPLKTPPTKTELLATYRVLRTEDPEDQRRWGLIVANEKAKSAAIDARNVQQYNADVSAYEKDLLAEQQSSREAQSPLTVAKTAIERENLAKLKRERELADRFGPIGVAGATKALEESHKANTGAVDALDAIRSIREIVNDGTFTGPLSTPKLYLAKIQHAAQPTGTAPDPRIVNTEAFRSNVTALYGALRPNVAGPGTTSDRDMEQLRLAAAGDTKIEKGSILKIIARLEANAVNKATSHQESHAILAGNNPNAQQALRQYSLPMERILPQSYVEKFKKEYREKGAAAVKELENEFFTPDLATKLFDAGRLD